MRLRHETDQNTLATQNQIDDLGEQASITPDAQTFFGGHAVSGWLKEHTPYPRTTVGMVAGAFLGATSLFAGIASGRETTTAAHIKAQIRTAEKFVDTGSFVADTVGNLGRADDCHRRKPGEKFKVNIIRRGGYRNSSSTTEPLKGWQAVGLEGSNVAGSIKVSMDIPLAGIHQAEIIKVPLCAAYSDNAMFSWSQERSPGNNQPVSTVHESIKGPGLIIITAKKFGKEGDRNRNHRLKLIPSNVVPPID